jgi:hypothetical protein
MAISRGEQEQNERIHENLQYADWGSMTFDDFEEMFEDRDPLEFL